MMFDNLKAKYKIPKVLKNIPLFNVESKPLGSASIQDFYDYLISDDVKKYGGPRLDIYLINTLNILNSNPEQIRTWMELTVSSFDDKITGAYALGSRLCLNELGTFPVLNNMHSKPGYGTNYKYFSCFSKDEPYLSVYKYNIEESFKYFSKKEFIDNTLHALSDKHRTRIFKSIFKDSDLTKFLYDSNTFKILFTLLEYKKEDDPDAEIERLHKYTQLLCEFLPEKDIDSRIKATMLVYHTYIKSQLDDAVDSNFQSSYVNEVYSLLDLMSTHFKFDELDMSGRILDVFYDLDESANCIDAVALVEASLKTDNHTIDTSEFNFDGY